MELRVDGERAFRVENPHSVNLKAVNLIGGSYLNSVRAGIAGATISGGGGIYLDPGSPSEIYPNSVGANFGTVGGGLLNTSSGYAATVGGGFGSSAQGDYGTVPGGYFNSAGGFGSFAAGVRAKANHSGAFVWADATDSDITSGADNEFTVRATGGVRFVSAIDANGTPTAGVTLGSGSGAWSSLSDRNAKDNFVPANGREILEKVAALPVATWNYKAQHESIQHIGPTAQDFRAAFGVGENDRTITTVDADGVALAAIQGLNQKLEEHKGELKRRLAKLEKILTTNER